MNEIEMAKQILQKWDTVERQVKLNQELYNMLGDSLFYVLRYAEKNNISLPNRDVLLEMVKRIHGFMDKIDIATATTHIRTTESEHPQMEHYHIFGRLYRGQLVQHPLSETVRVTEKLF